MIIRLFMYILWFCVWISLTWPPVFRDIITGLVVAAIVSYLTDGMLDRQITPFKRPSRYLWFLYYFVVFIWECVKANIDVAYRVIHPDLPIRPGTVRVRVSLKSDVGLTFLANTITLTPGTTSVDIDKDRGILYVHRIYIKEGRDTPSGRLAIVSRFENILKRIFD